MFHFNYQKEIFVCVQRERVSKSFFQCGLSSVHFFTHLVASSNKNYVVCFLDLDGKTTQKKNNFENPTYGRGPTACPQMRQNY